MEAVSRKTPTEVGMAELSEARFDLFEQRLEERFDRVDEKV